MRALDAATALLFHYAIDHLRFHDLISVSVRLMLSQIDVLVNQLRAIHFLISLAPPVKVRTPARLAEPAILADHQLGCGRVGHRFTRFQFALTRLEVITGPVQGEYPGCNLLD